MAEKVSGVAATCRRLAQPVAEELGLTLWDVRFVKEGASWYLRYWIDKDGGADLNDCVALSRRLNPLLDEADPIPCSYVFEVGSAGIERELKRPSDFEKFMGAQVSVKLYQAVNGQKSYVGELAAYNNGDITLDVKGKTVELKKAQIAQVKLHVDF